jgi:LytS/YehU family sensor histidine kinase
MRTDSANLKNDQLLQLITDRKFKVYRHVILFFFLFSFLNSKDALVEPINTYWKIVAFIFLLTLLYFNMYWLIPKLIFKEKYFSYFIRIMILLGITMALFALARYFLKPYFSPEYKITGTASGAFTFAFVFLIFIASSAAIKLFQRSIIVNQRVNELETLTIQSELEQLKNQINPHFLFNTLNNANVLTQKDPQKASQVLMKLSDLLRYQLYDSARNRVLLTADIRFLEDFLNLEKVRRDNFEFEIYTEGELGGVQVSPLLFIIFVENSVKHNIDAENASYVHISFIVQNSELKFFCVNSKPDIEVGRHPNGGLGLANVQRRLKLLYPGKHSLAINNQDAQFSVELRMNL